MLSLPKKIFKNGSVACYPHSPADATFIYLLCVIENMRITCENCQTQYFLNADALSGGGHKVRCTKCFHIWFVAPDGSNIEQPAAPEILPPEPAQAPEAASAPEEMPAPSLPEVAGDKDAEKMPASLKQTIEQGLPAIDHDTAGMGAKQFGLFVFLLLAFSTVIGLFFLRGPILRHAPAMTAFYEKVGLGAPVAGEGLKLSELTATQKAVMLELKAKLSNISHEDMKYPALKVIMRGQYGATIKEWDIKGQDMVLKPGESVPVSASFSDAPTDGKTIELLVYTE